MNVNNVDQEKIFEDIKDQFQNVDIICEVVQELTNWNIRVFATVHINDRAIPVIRDTIDLSTLDIVGVNQAIWQCVHVLQHALGYYTFVNPKAGELRSTLKFV